MPAVRVLFGAVAAGGMMSYAVTREGQRFLISTVSAESHPASTIVLNWPAARR